MLPPLARAMLDAYGGAPRWRAGRAVEARLSVGGLLFRWKRRGEGRWPELRVRVEVDHPGARLEPIDRAGHAAVLEGHAVRIEQRGGQVVESRANGRERFPYGRRLFSWDRLDVTYFLGYAMWNYLALPALLLREDIDWNERPGGALEARFPPHLPTHCERQQFHVNPGSGLLRQHDYTAEPFGGWAKAAHVLAAHGRAGDLTFVSRRRVFPRSPIGGRPLPAPLLIWADVHEYRLV